MSQEAIRAVRVELAERSYDVLIASGNLDALAELLADRVQFSRSIVITDSNVSPLYGERCRTQFQRLAPTTILEIPAGEQSKSVDRAAAVWEDMLARGAGRDTLVVGLGGGVVGDLAGFVAATFARGLSFVQIPTTLLAQVDSSVGGKVGINLSTAKNMVGAFWQPCAVVIDLDVLSTLPLREYSAGLAEVVKYGVINDSEFFGFLEANQASITARDKTVLAQIVARCCEIKAEVVAEDETERAGKREILNFGHTFAHAIEAMSGYGEHLHGEAVAVGMICASELARRLDLCSSSDVDRQRTLLSALGLPVTLAKPDQPRMLQLMRSDKKARQGRLRFVLPSRIGEVRLVNDVDDVLVIESINQVAV